MATRAQVNTLAARAARTMAVEFYPHAPHITFAFIRAAIYEAKQVGTPAARRVLLAMLRELYVDIFGVDPVGRRAFKQWVRRALTPGRVDRGILPDDPLATVSLNDGLDAIDEGIT